MKQGFVLMLVFSRFSIYHILKFQYFCATLSRMRLEANELRLPPELLNEAVLGPLQSDTTDEISYHQATCKRCEDDHFFQNLVDYETSLCLVGAHGKGRGDFEATHRRSRGVSGSQSRLFELRNCKNVAFRC